LRKETEDDFWTSWTYIKTPVA
jgi:hypothetical protein